MASSAPPASLSDFSARQVMGLFDALPDVHLFVKDLDSRFIHVNEAWLTLHGCATAAEALGKSDHDFHPPVMAAQYAAEDREVMRSRRPLRDQTWLVADHRGMPQWYLCTKIPLFDGDQRVVGIAGVLRRFDQAGNAPDEYLRLTPVMKHVMENYHTPLTVADLARRANLSASQLQREFHRLFNITVGDYILWLRLLMARRRLRETDDPIGDIATDCGFYDQAHFTRAFRKHTGHTPGDERRRGRRACQGAGDPMALPNVSRFSAGG